VSRQLDLSHIQLGDRPLVVCDVDDVVLRFIVPFQAFLEKEGHELLPRSFQLHGNVVSRETKLALEEATVAGLIETFFETQEVWQTPLDQVAESLADLSREADVVFLTAMPPLYVPHRRRLLDRFGFGFPLLATREPKGPIVNALHQQRSLPLAFIDDMAYNLHSVREHVPDCLLIHMVPESEIHRMAPLAHGDIARVGDWTQAVGLIRDHIRA
jgi:hypothetical protein